eukprot:3985249-Pleurochrysis_carterae.AAC.1
MQTFNTTTTFLFLNEGVVDVQRVQTTHHYKRWQRRRFFVSGVEGEALLRSTAMEAMPGHSSVEATPCYGGDIGVSGRSHEQ